MCLSDTMREMLSSFLCLLSHLVVRACPQPNSARMSVSQSILPPLFLARQPPTPPPFLLFLLFNLHSMYTHNRPPLNGCHLPRWYIEPGGVPMLNVQGELRQSSPGPLVLSSVTPWVLCLTKDPPPSLPLTMRHGVHLLFVKVHIVVSQCAHRGARGGGWCLLRQGGNSSGAKCAYAFGMDTMHTCGRDPQPPVRAAFPSAQGQ